VELPGELAGIADELTVVLPWGSLLAAVARPSVPLLRNVRALCRDGARLSVVLALAPERDRAEVERLRLPTLDDAHVHGALAAGYAAAGLRLARVRRLEAAALGRWPSTWARRLARDRNRRVLELEATAAPPGADPARGADPPPGADQPPDPGSGGSFSTVQ
jgi:16S rRNA (adenine(1408)-N(1))-methyltransferase